MRSGKPAGENGTTTRMGRGGNCCAATGTANAGESAMRANPEIRMEMRDIGLPPGLEPLLALRAAVCGAALLDFQPAVLDNLAPADGLIVDEALKLFRSAADYRDADIVEPVDDLGRRERSRHGPLDLGDDGR